MAAVAYIARATQLFVAEWESEPVSAVTSICAFVWVELSLFVGSFGSGDPVAAFAKPSKAPSGISTHQDYILPIGPFLFGSRPANANTEEFSGHCIYPELF